MSEHKNPVGWFEIYVDDMYRAIEFYRSVFNKPLTRVPIDNLDYELYLFDGDFSRPGAPGALVRHPIKRPFREGTLVYFSCEDCAVEAERAKNNGGTIVQPKKSIGPHGFVAIIGDSEGNAIGLHSMK
jgi:predicted enzyme related to lactoylglutathione lyase